MTNSKLLLRCCCSILLILIIIYVSFDLFIGSTTLSIDFLALVSFISVIICYAYVFTYKQYERIGFHSIIYTYTWLCHFGFLFATYLSYEGTRFRSNYALRFTEMETYAEAIELSLIAIIVFVLAFASYSKKYNVDRLCRNEYGNEENNFFIVEDKYSRVVFWPCILIICVGILFFGYLAIWNKGSLYGDTVSNLRSITGYVNMCYFIPLAYVLIISFCDKKKIISASVLFAIICLEHFSMGNRGEVMYAMLTSAAVFQLRFHKIRLRHVLFVGAGLLLLIPMVRINRQGGGGILESYANLPELVSSVLAEIGFQISSVTYTLHDLANGDSIKYGGTYLYGIFNFLLRRLPFLPQLPADSYLDVKNMMEQYGSGLGYSQIAETLYNFGRLGSIISFFIFGRLVLSFERSYINSGHIYKKMFIVCFMVELVNLTRNSSGTIIYYIVYSGGLMLLFYILSGDFRRNR